MSKLGVPVALQYDAADQLTSMTPTSPLAAHANLSYDANGNRTQVQGSATGLQASYTYDQANQLTRYRGPLGNAITTALGATGQPVAALTDAVYHYYGDGLRADLLWDRTQDVPQILADPTHAYITGPDGLPVEQINAAGQVRYYHHDQLGSTRAITSQNGLPLALYNYTPYGATIRATGTITDNPFGFAGQYTDPYSGLIYLRARNYDPASGQFTTRDPLEVITGQPYAYAGDDPINFDDPSGMILGIPGTPSWSQLGMRVTGFVDGVTSTVDPFGYGTPDVRDALGLNGGLDTCSIDYTAAETIGSIDGYGVDAVGVLRGLGYVGYKSATETGFGNSLFGRLRPGGVGSGPLGSPAVKGLVNSGPVRVGMGWKPPGQDVFRIAVGSPGGRIHGHLDLYP